MSYIFISYICVMLELLFRILRNEFYCHEQIFSYSSLSMSGAFSIKTNLEAFYDRNITTSADHALRFESELAKIIYQNKAFHDKIKLSDPSIFIMNHKQDFLNVYNLDWKQINSQLEPLHENKTFLCFYSNLLIHIPTVFKFAKVDISFQKNLIGKSINILKKTKLYSPPKRYLQILVKLTMMKVQCEIEDENPDKESINQIFDDLEEAVSNTHEKFPSTSRASEIRQLIHW